MQTFSYTIVTLRTFSSSVWELLRLSIKLLFITKARNLYVGLLKLAPDLNIVLTFLTTLSYVLIIKPLCMHAQEGYSSRLCVYVYLSITTFIAQMLITAYILSALVTS